MNMAWKTDPRLRGMDPKKLELLFRPGDGSYHLYSHGGDAVGGAEKAPDAKVPGGTALQREKMKAHAKKGRERSHPFSALITFSVYIPSKSITSAAMTIRVLLSTDWISI